MLPVYNKLMITCGKYECSKIIGEGAYSQVRIATDIKTGKKVALKLFKTKGEDVEKNMTEAQILEGLEHKNIIRTVDYWTDAELKRGDKVRKVSYIATELADKGSLFHYLDAAKSFSEPLARSLFVQILEAVEYMHSEGICHRDIKTENIFVDEKFNLKLGDFGFASRESTNMTQRGTNLFMAPEIHEGNAYNGKSVDVFALGVLLFVMVIGKYPFVSAKKTDCMFKLVHLNKMQLFWKITTRNKQELKDLSTEFKELIGLMLSPDPIERPWISDIKAMSWFNGPTLSYAQMCSELENLESSMANDDEYVSYH